MKRELTADERRGVDALVRECHRVSGTGRPIKLAMRDANAISSALVAPPYGTEPGVTA